MPRRDASLKYSLRDVLMAGLAMFVFKAPSLLHRVFRVLFALAERAGMTRHFLIDRGT